MLTKVNVGPQDLITRVAELQGKLKSLHQQVYYVKIMFLVGKAWDPEIWNWAYPGWLMQSTGILEHRKSLDLHPWELWSKKATEISNRTLYSMVMIDKQSERILLNLWTNSKVDNQEVKVLSLKKTIILCLVSDTEPILRAMNHWLKEKSIIIMSPVFLDKGKGKLLPLEPSILKNHNAY